MKFFIDNLYLIVIALVSGGLLIWPLFKRGSGSTALSPLEATQLINHRNAIVIDVRDEAVFAAGSLPGVRNLPFAKLAERAPELTRFKTRPVIVVCDSGQQSARALATLKKQGFEEAHSLAGGLAAWKQAGLPLVQASRDNGRAAQKDGGKDGAKDGAKDSAKGRARNAARNNEIRTNDKSRSPGSSQGSQARGPKPVNAVNGSAVIDNLRAKSEAGASGLEAADEAAATNRVKELS